MVNGVRAVLKCDTCDYAYAFDLERVGQRCGDMAGVNLYEMEIETVEQWQAAGCQGRLWPKRG